MTRCETWKWQERVFFFFESEFFFFYVYLLASPPPNYKKKKGKNIPFYLLEARLGRELLDRVPAVPQDALVAVDVRDLGAAGGGVDVAVVVEKRREKEKELGSRSFFVVVFCIA